MKPPPWLCYLVSRNPLMGGEYYRATRPAALLSRNFGWGTAVSDRMGTVEDGGRLSFLTPDNMIVTPNIIILRPIREWTQEWTDQAHANGQLVVADLDDDVWAHQDWEGVPRPNDDHFDDWFWGVDAVLVSTLYLKKKLIERGHKAPIYIAPNCYDPYGLQMDAQPGRTIGTRLWLSGRMDGDLEMYDELIQPLLEDLDLTFLHVGAEDGHRFTDRGWNPDRLFESGSVPIPLLPQALANLSIGAICMSDHPYNLAKTETHAAELAALGVPLVAISNHKLYRNIPGRVDAGGVRERVRNLLNPTYWASESERTKAWARQIAIENESAHMNALLSLLDVLYFREVNDTRVVYGAG